MHIPPLQETMDAFVQAQGRRGADAARADACMEMLAAYLVHFSDLFQDREMPEESAPDEWEEELEQQMIDLLDGDVEPAHDLGNLPLEKLDPEHVRDFLGWFVLRETSDAELLQSYAATLLAWFDYMRERGWWTQARALEFSEVVRELLPELVRAARLSRVLFHFARTGGGTHPRLRGKRFSRFVEGHGRVAEIGPEGIWFAFDGRGEAEQDERIGPVALPARLREMVAMGDVFDVELGMRGGEWVLVDVGPIYPACVYMEPESFDGMEKRT